MKRLVILLLIIVAPSCAQSKVKFYEGVIEGTDSTVYRDSLVEVFISAFGYEDYVTVYIGNRTSERLYIEWENCRIFDKLISFDEDLIDNYYSPRQDEMIIGGKRIYRSIRERSLSISSIFEWDDKVASGQDSVELQLAFRTPSGATHDISIVFKLREEKF